jgi:hypothetical protein
VITPRPRLMADSRSTGRLQSSNAHRSMTRLNAGKQNSFRLNSKNSKLKIEK